MQCRKRWGNLSWDLKKIVAWEKNTSAAAAETTAPPLGPSFWDMRGEDRRARQLPSSFDREVYDAIVGANAKQLSLPDSGEEMDLAEGGDDADEHPIPPPQPIMAVPISGQHLAPLRSYARTFLSRLGGPKEELSGGIGPTQIYQILCNFEEKILIFLNSQYIGPQSSFEPPLNFSSGSAYRPV
jgi:hypothetical protein